MADRSEYAEYLLGRVNDLKVVHRDLHKQWASDLKYYYRKPRETTGSRRSINLVYAYVEIHTAYMLSAVPELFVRSFDPALDDAADAANGLMEVWQSMVGLQDLLQDVFRVSSQVGTSFLRTYWDEPPDLSRAGRPGLQFLNPFQVLVDPEARSIDDCRTMFIEDYVTPDEALRRWPAMAKVIESRDVQRVETEQADWVKTLSEIAGQPLLGLAEKAAPWRSGGNERIQYIEGWVDGGRTLVKLLGGKLVTDTINGEQVTYPQPNPFAHGTFPVVPYYATKNPWSFWGVSDIRNIRDPQDEANVRKRQISTLLNHMAIVLTKLFVRAGKNMPSEAKLSTTDPQVIGLQDMAEVPCTIQSSIFQNIPVIQNVERAIGYEMDQITGIYDPAKGGSATGVYSGRHAAMLQGAASVRFQPRLDATMVSMKRLGMLFLSEMQQFGMMESNRAAYRVIHKGIAKTLETHDAEGNPILPRLNKESPRGFDPRFEIVVQATDEYPMARQQQAQFVMTLAQGGMADAEKVSQVMRIPGGEEMLARIGKKLVAGLVPQAYYPPDYVEQKYRLARDMTDLQEMQVRLQMVDTEMKIKNLEAQLQAQQPMAGPPPQAPTPPGPASLAMYGPAPMVAAGPGPGAEMMQEQAEMQGREIGAPS